MSFLDTLGEWTGIPRMANDISLAWSNAFEPEDQNVLVSAYAGIMGAGNRAVQWTSPTDHGAVPAIGNLAYQGAGVVTRGMATTTAINNYDRWKLPGQTEQQYRDMVTKSITDQDWQTSLGQVVLSDAAYNMDADTPWFARNPAEHLAISAGLKPGQNLNPFDPAQRETQFTGDGAPGKYQSGFYDAFSSNLADPTNLAGPAFKGYKALALGEKALVGTKVSSVWRPTSIAKTDFLDQLTNTNKYAGFVDFAAAESSAAKIAEHEYVKRSMRDPQLASYLLAKAGDRESVIDTLNILGKLGDDASVKAAADRLLAKAPDQGENAYLVDRIVNGEAEKAYQAATGSDHVLDPGIRDMQAKMLASFLNDDSNALGRAYQASLNKAMDAPVGTLSVTPKTGVAAKWNVAAAEARGDRLYAKPSVTYHQPTKAHPLMVAFDFFTKGRPSGYANTHDMDSFKEFSALVQHIDKYTDGALRGTGEAESWMNSYMAAQSATDRMSLFQNLEQRGVDIMAGNKGLDSETARSIYEFTAQKRRTALSAYEKDGFFSYLNNGNPALAVGPLTLRQAANDIHIALDFRQLDKTLNRISPDGWKSILAGPKSDMLPQGAWAAGRDKVVHGLDILNDLFKMNVLLRLGYTVRNLTEAGLSMAASGYMTSVAMTARPGEAAKAWAANRKIGAAQMADRMGVRTGRRESVRALQDEVGDALATLRTEDANAELMTQYLAGFKMDAADVPDDLYPVLARLRGETDRDVTYHLTTNGLPSIDGDFLATVSKRNVAQRKLDDMYTYRSVEDFGPNPAEAGPDVEELLHGTTAKFTDFAEGVPNRYGRGGVKKFYFTDNPDVARTFGEDRKYGVLGPEDLDGVENDAALRSLLEERLGPDSQVEVLRGDRWVKTDISKVTLDQASNYEVRRVVNPHARTVRAKVAGRTLDLRPRGFSNAMPAAAKQKALQTYWDGLPPEVQQWASGKFKGSTDTASAQSLVDWMQRFGHENDDSLLEVMRGAGYGKARVLDAYESGGESIIALPESIVSTDAVGARARRLMDLVSDARARLANGEALEYKTPQGWAPMTEKTIDSFMAARSHTGVFKPRAEDMRMVVRGRQRGAVPEVVAVPSYGRTLDARAGVAGVDVNDRTALAAYARENGYGRVVVDDPQWGETTLVLRDTADYAGGEGAAPVVRRHVQNIIREAEETGGIELMPPTPKQVRARNRAAATQAGANRNRNRARTNGQRSVIPGWSRSQVRAMVDSGLIDRLQEVGARRAQAKAALDFAEERYAARKAQASGIYKDKVQSNSGRGQAFDITSPQAQVMRSRTSSESTQDKLIGAGDEQMMMPATTMVSTTLSPNDSRYFEGWANAINHHMRDPESMTPDPLVKMLMDGKSEDDIVDWLEGAGRDHADYLGWGENLEDRVAELSSAFDLYVPEGQVRQAFANGEDITEDMLRGIYGRRQDLPDLQARLVPGAAEQRASVLADSLVARSARRLFHFLGALPETTFARHPLFVAAYDTERARLVEQLKARGHQSVTMENLNKIEFQAREFARQEVNRTLYTINRRTDAARQLRLVSPFYGAWENAIKRWSGFVWHNPDKVMRMTSKAAMVWNNVVIVDENGDVIPAEKALSNYDTFRNAQIVWPGADMSKIESASRINLASLDVITGGQPGPGLGPYGLLPLYEIAKDRPDIAETMSWAFPVGMPKDELDLFMSAAQKRIRSATTEDQTFVNDMNKLYQAEYIKYMNGERSTKPKPEEVRDSAKKLYGLRLLTSLTLPVSVDFNNDVDFYVNQLRTLRDLYKDEEGGEQKADAEFIDKYPEAFIVLPSLSDNRAGALATVGTVNNMKRYSNLASEAEAIGDLKMFGWVANYGQGNYSKDNFSQAAYSWQSNTRLPGSDTTYRGRQNTADLEAQALQDAGWVEFGRVMDVTEARLKAKGIDPTSKIGTKLLSEVRQAFSNDMKTKNPTWYQDYADPDRGKWERRAQFFSTVLADKQFMQDHGNDPLVKQIGVYLSFRNEVARALQTRDERGGSAMLSAKSNADIQAYWLGEVEKMKDANIEFAAWQTRYFTNDPVVF